jgi:hypothetical protein
MLYQVDWMSTLFHIFRFPILVFFVNAVLDAAGMYAALPWLDMPMHFAGGASIGLAGVHFLTFLKGRRFVNDLPFLLRTFFVMSFVGLAAALWELWEFSMDIASGWHLQADLFDTMVDILLGLLGGFVLSLLYRIR